MITVPFTLAPLILSGLLTIIFLHLDSLCCCCSCSLVPGQISVYDPDTDQRFLLKDGEIVEPPEEDLETGHTSSSLCCCILRDIKTADVSLTVIVKKEIQEVAEGHTNDNDDQEMIVD